MTSLDRCPECGVPSHITSEHIWLNNGVIVQSRDSRNRMVFIDDTSIEPVFQGIEKIIGVPLEQILITAKRKAVKPYLDSLIPNMTKELLHKREMSWKPINEAFITQASLTGYGKYEVVDFRFENDAGDYIIENISEPYSVPLAAGDMTGAFELLFNCQLATECREISPNLYELKCHVAPHDDTMEGRMHFRHFPLKEGNVELDRCESCGGPAALSQYTWNPERGVILNDSNGTRMVLTGMELDAIFHELEEELGEEIPGAVIKAKRDVVRHGSYPIEGRNRRGMQTDLALRGMGNIVELQSNVKGLHMKIENAFLHLIEIGMVQGLYEKALDVETQLEWEFSEQGDLEINLTPIS
jgi:hypothetical protein